jgi:thiamine-monophosphate kinase
MEATPPPPSLRQIGEFGLIDRLRAVLSGSPGQAPLVDLGDDAVAWDQAAAVLVASTDAMVEEIHFDLRLTGWHDLGWKAMAVNLSDLAAMGAAPAVALVTLGLRAETSPRDVEALYRGMRALADPARCRIVGGDTVAVRAAQVLSLTVIGTVPAGEGQTLLRRQHGHPGDRLAVTGWLGGAAAGLHALRHPGSAPSALTEALATAYRRPQPRLAAGLALRRAGVRCAMDISDGLMADLHKLCAASGCGAQVEAARLPLHPAAAEAFPQQALAWAAGGGDDYELLFAAPPPIMELAGRELAALGVACAEIGTLTAAAGDVQLVDAGGHPVTLPAQGWDHFAPPSNAGAT